MALSALHFVRLLPRANVHAQRTRRTNAFAAARGDKTAMRPFARLLWTLVIVLAHQQLKLRKLYMVATALNSVTISVLEGVRISSLKCYGSALEHKCCFCSVLWFDMVTMRLPIFCVS